MRKIENGKFGLYRGSFGLWSLQGFINMSNNMPSGQDYLTRILIWRNEWI